MSYTNNNPTSNRYQYGMDGRLIDTWAPIPSGSSYQGDQSSIGYQSGGHPPIQQPYSASQGQSYRSHDQYQSSADIPRPTIETGTQDGVSANDGPANFAAETAEQKRIKRWQRRDDSATKGRDDSILIRAEFQTHGITNNTDVAASRLGMPFLRGTLSELREGGANDKRGWLVEVANVIYDQRGKRKQTVYELVPPHIDTTTGLTFQGRPIITDKEKTYLEGIRASTGSDWYEFDQD